MVLTSIFLAAAIAAAEPAPIRPVEPGDCIKDIWIALEDGELVKILDVNKTLEDCPKPEPEYIARRI